MQAILDYLANSGEQLDSEIAAATGLSVATVRARATDLHAKGAIMVCRSIRYKDGKEVEVYFNAVDGSIVKEEVEDKD